MFVCKVNIIIYFYYPSTFSTFFFDTLILCCNLAIQVQHVKYSFLCDYAFGEAALAGGVLSVGTFLYLLH